MYIDEPRVLWKDQNPLRLSLGRPIPKPAPPVYQYYYYLFDTFITDENPVSTGNRVCEPGPENLTMVNWAGGSYFQVTNNTLYWDRPSSSQNLDNFKIERLGIDRQPGLTVYTKYYPEIIQNTDFFGTCYQSDLNTLRPTLNTSVANTYYYPMSASTWYEVASIYYHNGNANFIRGGDEYPNWTLMLSNFNNDLTGVDYKIRNFNGQFYTDDNKVIYNTDNRIKTKRYLTSYNSIVKSGTVANLEADSLINLDWMPDTNSTLDILFRREDDDNCFRLNCQQGNNLRLYRISGGSQTELDAGKTQSWSTSTTEGYKIQIRCENSGISTHVDINKKHEIFDTFNQSQTGVKILSSHSGIGNLECYPLYWRNSIEEIAPTGGYSLSETPDTNKIAVVFDIHASLDNTLPMYFRENRCKAIPGYINQVNPHAIIFGGDQGNVYGRLGDYELFKDYIWNRIDSRIQKYQIRGNHDEDFDSATGDNNQFTIFDSIFPSGEYPYHFYYDWTGANVRVIAPHTYVEHTGTYGGTYKNFWHIDNDESDWLAEKIDEMPYGYKAAVITHPPYALAFGNQIHYWLGANYLDSIINTRSGDIMAWFNGHRHSTNNTTVHSGVYCVNCVACGEAGYGFLLFNNEEQDQTLRVYTKHGRNNNKQYNSTFPIMEFDNGLLELFTGNIASYSTNLTTKNYNGSCIKIREGGSDNLYDIGFINGTLDSTSIASYCGSNYGYVDTWYDQGTGSVHLHQSNFGKQPLIYHPNSGVLNDTNGNPYIYFSGNTTSLTGIISKIDQDFSIIGVGNFGQLESGYILGSENNVYLGSSGNNVFISAGNPITGGSLIGGSKIIIGNYNGAASEVIENITNLVTDDAGSNELSGLFAVGSDYNGSNNYFNMSLNQLLIFNTSQS